MSDPVSPATAPPATDADGKLLLAPEEARVLLRVCFAQFESGLLDVVATSIDGTNDLFEENKFVTDVEWRISAASDRSGASASSNC
jgi:hypothetical protein